jgi:hypothetical protein
MGEIAKRWDALSDQQKVDELREPVVTRVSVDKAGDKGDFVTSFENFVVMVRRKAIGVDTLEQRAALADGMWADLRRRFQRAGLPHDFQEMVRRCLISETISWHWSGQRTDHPPNEGE